MFIFRRSGCSVSSCSGKIHTRERDGPEVQQRREQRGSTVLKVVARKKPPKIGYFELLAELARDARRYRIGRFVRRFGLRRQRGRCQVAFGQPLDNGSSRHEVATVVGRGVDRFLRRRLVRLLRIACGTTRGTTNACGSTRLHVRDDDHVAAEVGRRSGGRRRGGDDQIDLRRSVRDGGLSGGGKDETLNVQVADDFMERLVVHVRDGQRNREGRDGGFELRDAGGGHQRR